VTIWGPSLQQIRQAADFNGAPITVYAGMQPGLPLATAAFNDNQQGLLMQGIIWQAYGNWMGINQTLNFVIRPDGSIGTLDDPSNFVINWPKGTALGPAIQQVLTTVYPQYAVQVGISPNLVLQQDEQHTVGTLKNFAVYVLGISQDILGSDYQGVNMTLKGNVIYVYDGTTAPSAASGGSNVSASGVGAKASAMGTKQLNFPDFIGQMTWNNPFEVQFNMVLRADLSVGDTVFFPPLALTQSVTPGPQANSQARDQSTFSGPWQIKYIRHVGNSRGPDAQSWISTFVAIAQTSPQTAGSFGSTPS
jgi:hypothetical protein